MNKRLTFLLLILLGVVILLAQTTRSEVLLTATKVELNGHVKLTWTKPLTANATTVYSLYRYLPPDTAVTLVHSGPETFFEDQAPPMVSAMPRSIAYRVAAKTGAAVELSNTVIVPVPGVPLVGSFRLDGKLDSGKVKLAWELPPVQPADYYLVFGTNGDPQPPVKIDSTVNRYSVTAAPPVPPGAKMMFTYFVRAKLSSGEMLQSTAVSMMVENKIVRDDLKFTSIPNPNGQKSVPYQYTAKAVSSDPTAVVRYFAVQMYNASVLTIKIDSVTGVVDWTPSVKGVYRIEIVAKSNKGGMARQDFAVAVAGGNGIIQGKVTDTLNVNIPNVIIEAYKKENNLQFSYAYNVKTDANGNYRINWVDPGTYFLRANAPSSKYQSQWYNGQREVSKADSVIVIDSPAVSSANFKLRGGPGAVNITRINVAGSVTDTNGLAINNAETRVFFVRTEFALNSGSGMNAGIENFRKYFEYNLGDFRLEGNSEFVVKAPVDSLGKYSVKLPQGSYIVFARAKGYAVQFYKDQSNLLSAQILPVKNDTTGINFTLSPLPPVVLGAISGSVMDSVKNVSVPSRVIAFRDGWRIQDPNKIGRAYVTDTDSLGGYKFAELLPGTYVVMAIPLGSYAPAFYASDTMSIRWKRATKIVVNGNSIDNINIYVKPFGLAPAGYTGIFGLVTATGGNGNQNNSNRAGAIVYAYRNGEIAGYSITSPDGNYALTGLAPGQYTVFVDKAGYNETGAVTVNASYNVNGTPLPGVANFTIDGTLGVSEKKTDVQPVNYVLEQNYPNPFNPATTISFSLPNSGNVSLKVYNVVGQEVVSLVNGYKTVGQYTVSFNASSLSSGVYFYRLEAGSYNVVKKMMLLK
ncbi:MAG: carboxypeptidase regulatory-like domain-containing protein [Bacteroidota bacterium]